MAAAILAHLARARVRVESAGVCAGQPDPYVVAVMDEIGIDVSEHLPRALDEIDNETFDLVVSLSPEAHHHAVELVRTSACEVEYWPTFDATAVPGSSTREQRLVAYRAVRDELFQHIKNRFGLHGGPSV